MKTIMYLVNSSIFTFQKTRMNINNINITLIPSACSKVKTQESDYNSAYGGRFVIPKIVKHNKRVDPVDCFAIHSLPQGNILV